MYYYFLHQIELRKSIKCILVKADNLETSFRRSVTKLDGFEDRAKNRLTLHKEKDHFIE